MRLERRFVGDTSIQKGITLFATRPFLCMPYRAPSALGYQVPWFRIFGDWFGSTNLTFALVVCNFIGGLGCGALLSQTNHPAADRPNRHPGTSCVCTG